jgi:sugar phosphate permease
MKFTRKLYIPYKWQLVILLWFAFFNHQGDRQVYNVVIPLIKDDLLLSDTQIGLVATIFTLVYGILVPFGGFAGDMLRRKWIVFSSLAIFSCGTTLTGFSNGMLGLIIFRGIATGGGEAFYYPAATSLLGQFHKKTRAMALAIHQTALYAGIVVSGFLAGYIGERFGWRAAFLSFGVFGLVVAVFILFFMENTPLTAVEKKETTLRPSFREIFHAVFAKRTVLFLTLAFGAMVFVNVGYLTWMPSFMYNKFGMTLSSAGFASVFYHFLFAFFGVIAGGKISDYLAPRRRQVRIEVEYLGLFLAAPFIYLMAVANTLAATYLYLALFGFFRGIYDSNIFAAMFDVIEPRYRASSTGFMLMFAFLIGSSAPFILGRVSETIGMQAGLAMLSGFFLLGAILIFIALKFLFNKDFVAE